MGDTCSTDRGDIQNLVGKPERKTLLSRTRRRWEDKIDMDLK
jgi:hypothetical protein